MERDTAERLGENTMDHMTSVVAFFVGTNESWRVSEMSRKFLVFLLAVLLVSQSFPSISSARQDANAEYKLKAAYLYNFLQFTEWPPSAFQRETSPLIIGVFGRDPFGRSLEQIVQGESVNGREIAIVRIEHVNDIKRCHVLFIPRTEQGQVDSILSALHNANVLTVSEVDGFTDRGGAISFFVREKKLRFEINPNVVKKADLRVSSRLLRLAKVVGSSSGEN